MKLVITSIFTKSYGYAIRSQLAHIQRNLSAFNPFDSVSCIYVTDEPCPDVMKYGKELLPAVDFQNIVARDCPESPNYQPDAQRIIARMMSLAFSRAMSLGADYLWNVESDILPRHNNLRSLYGALQFDDYYSIAFSPYISQGKAGLLGGYGTLEQQILPDVYEDERIIPDDLVAAAKAHRAVPHEDRKKEWLDQMREIEEKIKQCPPSGSIFERQNKGFRRRGWGQDAMPQCGKGMLWEVDWIGTGNVLMDRRALAAADFTGYEHGGGTQDLYLCFWKWKPAGLRIACVPHSPCHHVVRHEYKDSDGKALSAHTVIFAYHEESNQECRGHIRHRMEPFFEFV